MLIGMSGYGRSGKNSCTAVLARDFDYTERAFADPLKEALRRLNPMVNASIDGDPSYLDEYFYDGDDAAAWERAKRNPEVRGLLQRMGTEVGRELFGANFWVDLALRDVREKPLLAFSDVRFKSEASAIKERGGKIIRVNRKDHGPVNGHKSEVELDDWDFDYIIENNGTLEDLAKEVHHAMQCLR